MLCPEPGLMLLLFFVEISIVLQRLLLDALFLVLLSCRKPDLVVLQLIQVLIYHYNLLLMLYQSPLYNFISEQKVSFTC